MKTLFISDLHLDKSRPEVAQQFMRFLEVQALTAQALYILGDFFELWVGDDAADEFQHNIMRALRRVSERGVPLYFMHGNRDFLIGQNFAKGAGCSLLPDPYLVSLEDQNVVLTHGDLLCTLDISYQRFRRFVRHPWVEKLYLSLPVGIRQNIAKRIRKKSQIKKRKNPGYSPQYDVTPTAVKEMMRNHQVQTLIHGHTHQPGIHEFILNDQPAKRIVLGEWGKTGSVLSLSAGQFSLTRF